MATEATAPKPQPTPNNLQFYHRRDEFMRGYHPATAEQRILLKQACHAWLHLEDMQELRAQLMAGASLLDFFQNHREDFKLILRHLAEAERMWRHSIEAYHKAQRQEKQHRPIASPPPAIRPPQPASAPGAPAANQTQSETHDLPLLDSPAAPRTG